MSVCWFAEMFHGKESGAVYTGVTGQGRRFKTHLPDAYRLSPLLRLQPDGGNELQSRSEDSAAEDDFLGIEQTDKICASHSPVFNGTFNYGNGCNIPLAVGIEDILCGDLLTWSFS